ncbi:MAG: hypothetical protein MR440_04665 [Firmicutes bacterium]|nr:hypothetical protein [Bacillota bacterium]
MKDEIESALDATEDFASRLRGVFHAMHRYYLSQPISAKKINTSAPVSASEKSDAVCKIFTVGSEINDALSSFISGGLVQGIVRSDINPALSVQIFWSSASALFELVDAKSGYLPQAFGMPEDELLEYGFRQLANSILEEKIILRVKLYLPDSSHSLCAALLHKLSNRRDESNSVPELLTL